MASENGNSHVGLVELEELEVIEIDEALLRELLEEQEDVGGGGGDVECSVESVENSNKMMDEKEEDQKQQKQEISCSEQREGCYNVPEFEWVNNMMEMKPTSQNDDMILNWYPDELVGMMVDFGYANGEFCSQISESLVSYEASYGCLWEDS